LPIPADTSVNSGPLQTEFTRGCAMWANHRQGIGWIATSTLLMIAWSGPTVSRADDIPLCVQPGDQFDPAIHADGSGGLLAAWTDIRTGSSRVYARRLKALGESAPGWPDSGLHVAPSIGTQDNPRVVADGNGGMFVAWNRNDGAIPPVLTFVQHLLADGTRDPAWPDTGVIAIPHRDPGAHRPGLDDLLVPMQMIADGSGGVIVVASGQSESGPGYELWVQRLTAHGTPATGWPAGGIPLGPGSSPAIVGDGAGGVIAAFYRVTNDGGNVVREMLAQHIPATGDAPDWTPPGGVLLRSMIHIDDGTGIADRPITDIATDGAGGAFVLMVDGIAEVGRQIHYLTRIGPSGVLAPGWPQGGRPVVGDGELEYSMTLAPDSSGGVYMAWMHEDDWKQDSRLKRIDADGTDGDGWPDSGLVVSSAFSSGSLLTSKDGGVFVTWNENLDVQIARFTGSGNPAPGWNTGGRPITTAPRTQWDAILTDDGSDGAIAVWIDTRANQPSTFFLDLYAGWVPGDGSVAVAASLISADASADRVRLTWQLSSAASARLERRDRVTWRELATLVADGSGRITYVDREVVAGSRYEYRLRLVTPAGTIEGGQIVIETPLASTFSFSGARPHPAGATSVLEFTIDRPGVTRIEIIDVAGRRVAQHTAALEVGRHVLPLRTFAQLAPGVYQVRLQQAERNLTRRIVVR